MDNTYELLSGASCSVSPWKPLSWSFFCVSLGRRLPGALVLVLGSSSPPSSEPRLLLCLGSFFLVYDLFFRSWCSGDFLRKGAKEVTLHVSIFKITPLLMLGRLAGHRMNFNRARHFITAFCFFCCYWEFWSLLYLVFLWPCLFSLETFNIHYFLTLYFKTFQLCILLYVLSFLQLVLGIWWNFSLESPVI